ncbi:MAG: FtsQ-type POTRA domain-containing protein [Rhodoluna sp.]|nr:FtsQ-type POTRA domain-containing protein [Rhodoluna sp.]
MGKSKVAANRIKIDRETVVRFRGKSRQAKAIVLTALGSLVALILLVLATIFTPLLAVENIKITGLQKIDEKKVAAAVKSQIGIPLALVTQQSVADQLSRFTLIESFSLVSELPHTLHIAISERQPICIVDVGGVSYLYDPAGVRLGQAGYKDTYPRVLIKGEPKSNASYNQAIDVLLALPAKLLPRISLIDAKSKDDVTMQLRGYAGQKIIWGDASQSALKSKVLAALIANQKQTDRVTFDVSSPTAPVVRYR